MKRLMTFALLCAALFCFAFAASAADEGLVAVAYRGDTSAYPPNSLKAIEAAFDEGADYVSVSVQKTADGAFVLLEDRALPIQCDAEEDDLSALTLSDVQALHLRNLNGTVSDEPVATLEEALALADGKGGLILDNAWDDRDALHAFLQSQPPANVLLRTTESAKKALTWKTKSGSKMPVVCVYRSNVVMNAIAHWNRLQTADMPLVQFQSKNYFNVFYQKFTAKRFHEKRSVSALAPTYDPMLCGRRSDDATGWDDLISRGFAAIETGNLRGLLAYIRQTGTERAALEALIEQAEAVPQYKGSALEKAYLTAIDIRSEKRASLSQLQSAQSVLQNELRHLTPADENEVRPGDWQVTPGKIIAIVVFGALLLGFDVFVYKKKKKV